jgi:hypothetical protein
LQVKCKRHTFQNLRSKSASSWGSKNLL